jgi:hypothetical protein
MAGFVLRDSIPSKILFVFAGTLFFALTQTPVALAQRAHVGGHHSAGARPSAGGRMAAPAVRPAIPHAAAARPRVLPSARLPGLGVSPRSFRVPMRPGFGFRRPFFVGEPFSRFAGFNRTTSWFGCGVFYDFNLNCNSLSFYGTGFENYVTVPTYVNPPYAYLAEPREEIWLYLKDGTVYGVTDYWFVNGQVHFTAVDEPGMPPVEQVIDMDEFDWQKTTEVNTRRGFRIVMRDEPWQQYWHDHPNETPPPVVAPPPKN